MATFKIFFGQTFTGPIYMRPDADSVDGGWTNEVDSNVNLFPSIDEASEDDADYIKSSENPVADICKISLGNPSTTITTPMTLRYRYKKTGFVRVDLTVRLMQGSGIIATFTHTDISRDYVTAAQDIAPSPAIADPTNLFLEFEANKP